MQKDVPQSYAWIRVGVQDCAVQDMEIMNASINNDAVNTKKRQQCKLCGFIAPSTVKWNLGFGSLSRLISPGFTDPLVGQFLTSVVAWKQHCCVIVWKSLSN